MLSIFFSYKCILSSLKIRFEVFRDQFRFRWKLIFVCMKAQHRHPHDEDYADKIIERWLQMFNYKLTLELRTLLQRSIDKFKSIKQEVSDV